MSPVVIDLRSAGDTGADEWRDMVHRALQALAEGKLVAFPTETVYAIAASGLSDSAVENLLELAPKGSGRGPVLAVKSVDEAIDYVPDLGPLGQRLARRCWPGPVTLMVRDQHPESLLKQLAPAVQQVVAEEGELGLRVPAHQALQDVLRLLAGPAVLINAPRQNQEEAVTAQQVVEAWDNRVQLVLDDGRSRFGQPSSVVRVLDDTFEVVRLGVVSEQTIKRLASVIILFICTGNTCRSPMAEGMFRHRVAERLGCKPEELEDRGVIIMSAGIAAMMGGRPSPDAVTVMADLGVDLSAHESQPLTAQLVRHADLLLTMTRSHRQAILAEWPDASERTRLLCHDGTDVADPVGGPTDLYRRCAGQIGEQLDDWLKELRF
ncbi:MAG TPA: Sua5/YciO/YrdC/YwlC family protein [Pirellulales bacterium]|jgi:protein-tyrosine phosphatase|nr:Sua5/YciO/YrdC/YwlC family protein [Pirellulales bacterium]